MQNQVFVRRATTAIVAIVLVSGCSSSGTQLSPLAGQSGLQSSATDSSGVRAAAGLAMPRPGFSALDRSGAYPGWMRFAGDSDAGAAAKGRVYVSQFYGGQIDGYKLNNQGNGAPACAIGRVQDVNGIAADQNGNLYVPQEQGGSASHVNKITVFAPDCGKLLKTLSTTVRVIDVAFDGSTVYATGNGVQIYANGATAPTGTLVPPCCSVYGVAVDSQHDVFASTYAPNSNWNSEVVEFLGGSNPAVELKHTLVIGASFPAGVLIDKRDNLLVVNPYDNSSLAVYAPPYTRPAKFTIVFNGAAQFCAFNQTGDQLYCTDYEYGSVDVYKYPAGIYLYSFTNGINWNNVPEGMAVTPAMTI